MAENDAGAVVGAAAGNQSETVGESRDGAGVVRLTMNRPDAFNALSEAMLDALTAALARHAQDPTVRVVVIAGAGKAFCAGHDLKELTAHRRDEDGDSTVTNAHL